MLLEIAKQSIEKVEVPTPASFKDRYGQYHLITKHGTLITLNGFQITVWEDTNPFYKSNVEEVLRATPCENDEFLAVYKQAQASIEMIVEANLIS